MWRILIISSQPHSRSDKKIYTCGMMVFTIIIFFYHDQNCNNNIFFSNKKRRWWSYYKRFINIVVCFIKYARVNRKKGKNSVTLLFNYFTITFCKKKKKCQWHGRSGGHKRLISSCRLLKIHLASASSSLFVLHAHPFVS